MVVFEACEKEDCNAFEHCLACPECGAPPRYGNRKCPQCEVCLAKPC